MDHSHHHGHQQHPHQTPTRGNTTRQQHSEVGGVSKKSNVHTSHLQSHHAAPEHAYDKHAGHHTHDFLKRFWLSLALTIPLLALSEMIQHWFGFHIAFTGGKYVLLALGSIIYFYGGWPFLTGMVREIIFRNLGMMTLVALAITVAYVYSVAIVFGLKGMDFFWELATLIDIMLLGHRTNKQRSLCLQG